MLAIFTSSKTIVMKNSINITFLNDRLSFSVEGTCIYTLNNLPTEERIILQHYFDLIRDGYQDYFDGTKTLEVPSDLIKALMLHIAGSHCS